MISKTMRLVLCVLAMSFCANALADGWTANKPIASIVMWPTDYYFAATGGWGSTDCPTAVSVWLPLTDPNANRLFAAMLAARANNALVVVYGPCVTVGSNTFILMQGLTTN